MSEFTSRQELNIQVRRFSHSVLLVFTIYSSTFSASEHTNVTRTDEGEDILAVEQPIGDATTHQSDEATTTPGEFANQTSLGPNAESPPEPPTVEELLMRARRGAVAEHEAMLQKLAEREAVGQALKNTLQVAEEIASFGNAGVSLLNDASLDEVVAALVRERNQLRAKIEAAAQPTERDLAENEPSVNGEAAPTGFDTFTPVFIQRVPLPLRVGLRHIVDGEFVIVNAGQAKELDGDTVRLLRVSAIRGEQVLVFDVNGEERRAYIQ